MRLDTLTYLGRTFFDNRHGSNDTDRHFVFLGSDREVLKRPLSLGGPVFFSRDINRSEGIVLNSEASTGAFVVGESSQGLFEDVFVRCNQRFVHFLFYYIVK